MKHTLTPQRYLILLAVMLTASVGDTLLSHGMAQVGPVTLAHLGLLLAAIRNPWVIIGIFCLLGFFASYLTALSWADLTFVLPSTAFGYIVVAFLARFWLHEPITPYRWAGILLIVCGVGFVANGPSLTLHESHHPTEEPIPAGEGAVTGGTK
ncbi:MAG: DMT family transporter [Acidobacteriaceae bacterium]|jgi:drug/metabolite transporter (DMT)-like permease